MVKYVCNMVQYFKSIFLLYYEYIGNCNNGQEKKDSDIEKEHKVSKKLIFEKLKIDSTIYIWRLI